MRYLVIICLLFISAGAFSQRQERPIVQFSGVIHNADSDRIIVPYVNITNQSFHNKVVTSNYEGYFSFVAHEQDTIHFTCVGYAPVSIIVPVKTGNKSFIMEVKLKPLIINLPIFNVFPWATTDEFTKDFLTMKVADDDLEIARKNLNLTSILYYERTLPRDGSEAINANEMHNNVVNSHSITNPLLNPFAWGALIKEISDGTLSRAAEGN